LNPCTPCRHSTTLTISFSCSRVASLSCGFGGVLRNMAKQGCFRNVRFATISLFLDSAVLNPCTKKLRNSLSTLKTMNSTNCTPANQLYIIMTVCSDRRRHVTCDVTWCYSSCRPAYYTRTHHNHQVTSRSYKIQVLDWNIQQEQGKESVKQDRERERERETEITIAGYSKIKGQRKKKETEKEQDKEQEHDNG